MVKLCLLILCMSSLAQAKIPDADLFNNPAMLIDYQRWIQERDLFAEAGSERRAFVDLIKIVYDWDLERPWGQDYFPQASQRLSAFQKHICASPAVLKVCSVTGPLFRAEDVVFLKVALQEPALRASLEKRWNVRIEPWCLPFQPCDFSFLAGVAAGAETLRPLYWNLQPESASLSFLEFEMIPDKGNYRAGFDSKEVAALFALSQNGLFLNQWQSKQRAMTFATQWKHVVESNHDISRLDPVIDAVEIQFLRLYHEQSAEFAGMYLRLYQAVDGHPTLRSRFESERAAGRYPDEVYHQIAHADFLELLRVQGGYAYLASHQRRNTSERQKALESLLTIQRYVDSPRLFAMELSTILQPFASYGYVLDQTTDATMAATYLAENLNALLGLDVYEGKTLFPRLGVGLRTRALFNEAILQDQAPDVLKELAGRDFEALSEAEQLRLLRLYLRPAGKTRMTALLRMGTVLLATATTSDLRELADVIHAARAGSFQ